MLRFQFPRSHNSHGFLVVYGNSPAPRPQMVIKENAPGRGINRCRPVAILAANRMIGGIVRSLDAQSPKVLPRGMAHGDADRDLFTDRWSDRKSTRLNSSHV